MGDTIKVGDQEYTPDQISEMATQNSSLNEQMETFKPLIELSKRYDIPPAQLASETQGAFSALLGLQEAGVLDKDGNVVEKAAPKSDPPPSNPNPPANPAKPEQLNADQIAQRALDSVNPTIKALTDEVQTLRGSLNNLYREKIQDKVSKKGYDVTDDDINLALAKSKSTGDDFWKVLDERAGIYKTRTEKAVKDFAETHGLNIEELNKIQDAKSREGGVAQSIVGKRKISSKGGPDSISPRDATQRLFEMSGE